MLEIQPGRFVLKSRESLHGRELDVVVDSQTGVNYVTYLASSSAPLSPLLDKDGKLPRVGRALMADAIGTVPISSASDSRHAGSFFFQNPFILFPPSYSKK